MLRNTIFNGIHFLHKGSLFGNTWQHIAYINPLDILLNLFKCMCSIAFGLYWEQYGFVCDVTLGYNSTPFQKVEKD